MGSLDENRNAMPCRAVPSTYVTIEILSAIARSELKIVRSIELKTFSIRLKDRVGKSLD